MEPTLLVTGASGQLGARVLHHLLHTLKVPAGRVFAASRKPEALAEWAAQGVTVRAADFDNADALPAAFQGVQRVLVVSTDALDRPGRRLEQHRNALRAAEQAGVAHLVYTSMPKPESSAVLFAPDHAGTEAALAASALPGWTVLRDNWYFENQLMGLAPAIASGKWYSAEGDGRIAHIARDDVARAAACVLAGNAAGKTRYTLTGCRAYSRQEIVSLLSRATGKPIEVVPVPLEGLVQGMVAAGMPQPIARVVASFDANTAAGGLADVTGDYRALTGVEPQSFEAWVAASRLAA
ncbi:MAG: SDR family oxidoreductase [Burkholderiales bacterium]|nr:SDR family oxidoreductase [Burkholderiales bacterium]